MNICYFKNESIFKKIKLNIEECIPIFHKSIVLDSGEIIITGGSLLNGEKSKKIERLNLKEMNLKEIGEMKMRRSSHGMV